MFARRVLIWGIALLAMGGANARKARTGNALRKLEAASGSVNAGGSLAVAPLGRVGPLGRLAPPWPEQAETPRDEDRRQSLADCQSRL